METTSENRIIVLLREMHKTVWKYFTAEQKRIALKACDGKCDEKTLERAFRIARRA